MLTQCQHNVEEPTDRVFLGPFVYAKRTEMGLPVPTKAFVLLRHVNWGGWKQQCYV